MPPRRGASRGPAWCYKALQVVAPEHKRAPKQQQKRGPACCYKVLQDVAPEHKRAPKHGQKHCGRCPRGAPHLLERLYATGPVPGAQAGAEATAKAGAGMLLQGATGRSPRAQAGAEARTKALREMSPRRAASPGTALCYRTCP